MILIQLILALFSLLIPDQESRDNRLLNREELDMQLKEVTKLRDAFPDSSFKLTEKYIWNTKAIGYSKVLPHLYHNLGAIASIRGEYRLALIYADSALRSATGVVNDPAFYTRLKSFMGTVYADMGNYDEAVTMFDEALQESKRDQDTVAILIGHMRLGIIFDRMDLLEQSRINLITALELADATSDISNTYNILNNLAVTYARRNEFEQALPYFLQAEELEEKYNPDGVAPNLLGNIGRTYLLIDELDKAEVYLKKGIEKAAERKSALNEAQNANSLGQLYFKRELWGDAEKWYLHAQDLCLKFELNEELINTLSNLKTITATLGRYKESLAYTDALHEFQYELDQKQRFEIAKEIESKYAIETTRNELNLLKELNISNRKQRNIAGLALIITTGFSAGLILLYRKQQRTAKKLQNEKARLKLANDTKTRLFSIIGHDLRNPIGGILNGLNLMMDEDISAEEKQELGIKIQQLGKETLNTLEDLLLWGRVDSYKTKQNYISISDNIKQVIRINQEQARQKNIQVNFEDINENLVVYADLNEFAFILRNFLSNAIKFTPEGGEVSIGVVESTKKRTVFVKDNGIGMDAERLEKIRKREKLVSAIGTNKELGTGIGLLICHELAEKNNAYVEVISEEGKGTTFSLVFELED